MCNLVHYFASRQAHVHQWFAGFPATSLATAAELTKRGEPRAHITHGQISHRDGWNQGHWQGHRLGLRSTRCPGLRDWTERTRWRRDGGGPGRRGRNRDILSRRRQEAGGYGRGGGDGRRRLWWDRHSLCQIGRAHV